MLSRRAHRSLIVLALAALAALGGGTLLAGGRAGGGARVGRVERVVDGDTIVVRLGGRDERVRYIGIDTPESVKPGTPVQCFAEAAAAANRRLVGGRRVRLVPDAERARPLRAAARLRLPRARRRCSSTPSSCDAATRRR